MTDLSLPIQRRTIDSTNTTVESPPVMAQPTTHTTKIAITTVTHSSPCKRSADAVPVECVRFRVIKRRLAGEHLQKR
jgi:hypothetical protein